MLHNTTEAYYALIRDGNRFTHKDRTVYKITASERG